MKSIFYSVMGKITSSDLDHILKHTENCWKEFNGAKIFFTGGTGLFGVWMLEAMSYAQKKLGIHFDVTLLSRNPEGFLEKYPHFKNEKFIRFHKGNITDFSYPEGEFTHTIHGAATSAHAILNKEDEIKKFDNVSEGTRRVLEFTQAKSIRHFLLISSGSAYGKQPRIMPLMREDYMGAPDTMDIHSALGEGERAAEYVCNFYAHKNSINMKVARCFSFVGPHLPLDMHYAIGNFIGDGLKGRPISVRGDGSPVRSYLYMSDLVIWLITIFVKGESLRIYNVGSEEGHNIREIAQAVANCFEPKAEVHFAQKPSTAPGTSTADLYVPSTARARALDLEQWIGFEESMRRTIEFYRS